MGLRVWFYLEKAQWLITVGDYGSSLVDDYSFSDCAVIERMLWCCIANCRKSLGMHSGAIADNAITASSSYDSASVGPSNGRYALHSYIILVYSAPFGRRNFRCTWEQKQQSS